MCICFNPTMCIRTSVIGLQRVNCACKHARKNRLNVEISSQCRLFDHAPLHSVPSPIISNSHYTENTCLHGFVVCPHSREKATHTRTHTHTTRCWMCEQSKGEKLNYKCRSASTVGSHDISPSVSQHEVVISLAPDCMCVPTADTFFDEKQYPVGCVRLCV